MYIIFLLTTMFFTYLFLRERLHNAWPSIKQGLAKQVILKFLFWYIAPISIVFMTLTYSIQPSPQSQNVNALFLLSITDQEEHPIILPVPLNTETLIQFYNSYEKSFDDTQPSGSHEGAIPNARQLFKDILPVYLKEKHDIDNVKVTLHEFSQDSVRGPTMSNLYIVRAKSSQDTHSDRTLHDYPADSLLVEQYGLKMSMFTSHRPDLTILGTNYSALSGLLSGFAISMAILLLERRGSNQSLAARSDRYLHRTSISLLTLSCLLLAVSSGLAITISALPSYLLKTYLLYQSFNASFSIGVLMLFYALHLAFMQGTNKDEYQVVKRLLAFVIFGLFILLTYRITVAIQIIYNTNSATQLILVTWLSSGILIAATRYIQDAQYEFLIRLIKDSEIGKYITSRSASKFNTLSKKVYTFVLMNVESLVSTPANFIKNNCDQSLAALGGNDASEITPEQFQKTLVPEVINGIRQSSVHYKSQLRKGAYTKLIYCTLAGWIGCLALPSLQIPLPESLHSILLFASTFLLLLACISRLTHLLDSVGRNAVSRTLGSFDTDLYLRIPKGKTDQLQVCGDIFSHMKFYRKVFIPYGEYYSERVGVYIFTLLLLYSFTIGGSVVFFTHPYSQEISTLGLLFLYSLFVFQVLNVGGGIFAPETETRSGVSTAFSKTTLTRDKKRITLLCWGFKEADRADTHFVLTKPGFVTSSEAGTFTLPRKLAQRVSNIDSMTYDSASFIKLLHDEASEAEAWMAVAVIPMGEDDIDISSAIDPKVALEDNCKCLGYARVGNYEFLLVCHSEDCMSWKVILYDEDSGAIHSSKEMTP